MATELERTSWLFGETEALKAFAVALCFEHPDPKTLLERFELSAQHTLSGLENQAVNESMIEAHQHVVELLRSALLKTPSRG